MTLRKIRDQIIYKTREHGKNYNSFPSAVLTSDGSIVVAFRQARDMRHQFGETQHYDPASRAAALTSRDGGESFTHSLIYDDLVEGVQDPCINLLHDGTLLATFFSWNIQKKTAATPEHNGHNGHDRPAWPCYDERYIARLGDLYTLRSADGGATWDTPVSVSSDPLALRGTSIELADGSLLIPAYTANDWKVSLRRSTDRGETWHPAGTIEHPGGVNETSLFATASGKLIAFIRSNSFERGNPATAPLITAESGDGGVTWSRPVERGIHSPSPYHPLQLRSGRVLISYGYRFAPFGIRAVLLDGECEQWDALEEVTLREDGQDEDIGYTSAVQLANGEIWIFHYYYDSDGYRYIAATVCREE